MNSLKEKFLQLDKKKKTAIICGSVAAIILIVVIIVVISLNGKKEEPKPVATATPKPTQTPVATIEPTPVPAAIPIDFNAWQAYNPDVYAWIYVPGTSVNYPILQSATDNSYYLDYNIDGTKGYPGCVYSENINSKDFLICTLYCMATTCMPDIHTKVLTAQCLELFTNLKIQTFSMQTVISTFIQTIRFLLMKFLQHTHMMTDTFLTTTLLTRTEFFRNI